MTNVFISYKRKLRPRIEQIAEALRALHLEVWFDATLEPGTSFSAEISREVRSAKCVLACFSNDAFPHGGDEHGWVLGEATIGRDRKVLVAALLEPTDLDPPWNMVHAEDLSQFVTTDSLERTQWQNVLAAVGRHVGRPGLGDYDRAVSIGTADALGGWARKYPFDPLAPSASSLADYLAATARQGQRRESLVSPASTTQQSAGDSADHIDDPQPQIEAENRAQGKASLLRSLGLLTIALALVGSGIAWRLSMSPIPGKVVAVPSAERSPIEQEQASAFDAAREETLSMLASKLGQDENALPDSEMGAFVQFAVLTDEADALRASITLERKFAAELNGHNIVVERVRGGDEVAGYRVFARTSTLSEAISICQKVVDAGGECFGRETGALAAPPIDIGI